METYMPITEAAASSHIPEKDLLQLVQSGRIRSTMLSTTGAILLNERDVKSQIPRENREEYREHAHLAGTGIGIREASLQYGIPHRTISRWAQRGFIQVISHQGRKVLIDAADVAYCAKVYLSNPGQGKWVFSKDGNPYTKQT